jgi:hypothetical protein
MRTREPERDKGEAGKVKLESTKRRSLQSQTDLRFNKGP